MKRALLAILSLALGAGFLTVAAEPTQAASTKATSSRLAGLTRYETAIEVARQYIESRRASDVRVLTAILTSGEDRHFGYPLLAPALARHRDAPLLLTEPRELPPTVEAFLRSSTIEIIVILGGSHIVSTDVEEALVEQGYIVSRIAGDDVYDTAVEVAEHVGTPGRGDPGTYLQQGRTSLVATGEVFADALAAGPLAYRGHHPLLFTRSTSLPSHVAQFLQDSGTEHVIILGGSAAVSTTVERSIADMGITVDRLAGRDRYGTAVRIAEELLGPDSPHECFDGAGLGLAYGGRAADAVVSGPLLGAWCAPLLLVGHNALPPVVEHFLEADEFATGGDRDQLHLTAFGGSAAVSSFTVLLAVAAGTLEHITAQLSGVQGRCYFDVTFDDLVRAEDAQNIGSYARAGTPLIPADGTVDVGHSLSTTTARIILAGSVQHPTSVEPVGCNSPLEAGQQIDVAGDSIRGESGRHSVRRSVSVVEEDRVRPQLSVNVDDASTEAVVMASEPIRLRTGVVKLRRELPRPVEATVTLAVAEGSTQFDVPAPREFGEVFRAGDRIVIAWGAVEDLAGNQNVHVTERATGDNTPPRVIRASAFGARGRASAAISMDGEANGSTVADALTISTQRLGEAYGAAGNAWTVEFQVQLDWPANRRTELTIASSGVGGRLTVSTAADRTLTNVAIDLNGNAEFRQLFSAEVSAGVDSSATLNGSSGPARLRGGISTVDLRVSWSEPVLDCDADAEALDLGRLLLDIDADDQPDVALDGRGAARFGLEFVEAPDGNAAIVAGRAACDTAEGVPPGTVVARLESADHTALPSMNSRLLVRAGAAVDLNGNRTREHRIDGLSRS